MGARGEGDDRGWHVWMASLTQWTWVWVNSRSWWWTGRPGMLPFMGSQRVRHDWATELNWTELNSPRVCHFKLNGWSCSLLEQKIVWCDPNQSINPDTESQIRHPCFFVFCLIIKDTDLVMVKWYYFKSITGMSSNILADIGKLNQNNQNGLKRRPRTEIVILNWIAFVIWSKFSENSIMSR